MDAKIPEEPYKKRALTPNMFIQVATNDAELPMSSPAQFEKLVKELADAETAGCEGCCPLTGHDDFTRVGMLVQSFYRVLSMRKTQVTAVISAGYMTGLTDEYAAELASSGSIAFIAQSYDMASLDALVKAGVLPLLSEEPIAPGTWLFLRGIRNDVEICADALVAYKVTDVLTPFELHLPDLYPGQKRLYPEHAFKFSNAHLSAILEG